MSRLFDKIEAQDKMREEKAQHTEKKRPAVSQIVSSTDKDKQISAKVNSSTYALFNEINKMYGLSNNSVINMLISQYVMDKKSVLDRN